jgi:hypothetical protein
LCVETNIFFSSTRCAAKSVQATNGNIYKSLNNPNKTFRGYHWRFATPEEIKLIDQGKIREGK